MNVAIVLPCFNETETALELVSELHALLSARGDAVTAFLVDDGSTTLLQLPALAANLPAAGKVLRLRRNLGHQRAIAVGLCHIAASEPAFDAVVVMDSDGEDRPEDVPCLLDALQAQQVDVVFAWRSRRSEGLRFGLGYRIYLLLHTVLLGSAPRVGNFSVLAPRALNAVVVDTDLWSHYAATLWKSRLSRQTVPIARGTRRRGTTHLGWQGLILHGLSAICCYRELLAVRLLMVSGGLFILALAYLLIALPSVPTRGIQALLLPVGLCSITLLLAFMQCFLVLQARGQATVLPLRDYTYFIDTVLPFSLPSPPSP